MCQTYSWNKGGLKLFRFQEYGPFCLDKRINFVTIKRESTFRANLNIPVFLPCINLMAI